MTLVETIVATAVSAFVLTGLFGSLGSIYFSQKKITATQRFASETRFLMERVVQMVRNNTLDYDRFFVEVGPDYSNCSSFDENQVPAGTLPVERTNDSPENRENLGYTTIFYWNVVSGGSTQIRHLGGKKPNPLGGDDIDDPCAEAWGTEPLTELYLINRARTQRVALRLDTSVLPADPLAEGRLQIQRMLGADTDDDLRVDTWGLASTWDAGTGQCEIFEDAGKLTPISSPAFGVTSEKECADIYDWVNISPRAIEVDTFEFIPSPNRDPYLNYRVDSAQVHPQVFVRMDTKIRRPQDFGLKSDAEAFMTLQTTATSRVFGNPRD